MQIQIVQVEEVYSIPHVKCGSQTSMASIDRHSQYFKC